MNQIIEKIASNPVEFIGLILLLVELFVRLRPTEKNLSILDKLHQLINLILPNVKECKKKSLTYANNKIIEKFKIK